MNIVNNIKKHRTILFLLILFLICNIICSVNIGIPVIEFYLGLIYSAISYVIILFIIDWFIRK
jgi:biotin transporter BioY